MSLLPKFTKKKYNNDKCRFCEKLGHFQKDCLKRKTWFKKKGKPSDLVCFESNLAEVSHNTWWIDFGCIAYVSNMMQGFFTT